MNPTNRDLREPPRRMTFDEAARLDPDDQPGEIVGGTWIPMPWNTWRHGEIAGNVYAQLRRHARANPGWSVAVGDPGARLRRDPDVLRGPDVAMVHAERRPSGQGAEGWLDGAPDLAVEVVGDGQAVSQILKKALEYLAAGCKTVWVLDPEPEQVIVVTPPDHLRVLGTNDTLDGGDLLPGFQCPVAELFER